MSTVCVCLSLSFVSVYLPLSPPPPSSSLLPHPLSLSLPLSLSHSPTPWQLNDRTKDSQLRKEKRENTSLTVKVASLEAEIEDLRQQNQAAVTQACQERKKEKKREERCSLDLTHAYDSLFS
jgi:hypothetical protein